MHTNRLIREKSPYLLQHARNPVDWYPWGEEAFAKASAEDKPVFLSIGYSTCHWCHVMETESFENEAMAALLNKHFVAIKVDREERPDIDHVYMDYVTATTGGGGWPMTVFLTPDKKPFYGGTYFPPKDRYGMPGLENLLSSIADAWKNSRSEILQSADSAAAFLAGTGKTGVGARSPRPLGGETPPLPAEETLKKGFERFAATFDSDRGGFGRAPKFPRSHALSFLLRYWLRSGDTAALEMAEKTLTAMAHGGMYDQLGGGFHRYSTDGEWRVPHFEKMLYDQALLSRTYLEAYQATHNPVYARVSRETLDYVLREMTDPQGGGFYSAQDADSPDPANPAQKREGAYFVWRKDEIKVKDDEVFCYYFGIEPDGNTLEDPHHEFVGQNVLYAAHSVEETASHFKLSAQDVEKIIRDGKSSLLTLRLKRPAPGLDDKILTDWNGLMIASFAFASRVLNEPRYSAAAQRAGDFVLRHLKNENGALWHRYREGEAAIPAHLDDYAFMIYGMLELYEATFDVKWLAEARNLAGALTDLFWDEERGGFFLTAKNAEALITRPKEIYDGAVPSGNSVAALDLLRLERITADSRFKKFAQGTLKAFTEEVSAEPTGYPQMLVALDFAIGPSSEIVVAAPAGDEALEPLMREIYSKFIPNKIVLLRPSGKEGVSIEDLAPFVKDLTPMGGKPTVFMCRNYACSLPVTDAAGLKKILNKEPRPS